MSDKKKKSGLSDSETSRNDTRRGDATHCAQKTDTIKVGMISLGCAKNLVDSEVMLGNISRSGMKITSNPDEADVLIINTCSFIDSAKEESVDTILETANTIKRAKPGQCLIVSGCLPQLYKKELPSLLPEVDAFIGLNEVENIVEIIKEAIERKRIVGTQKDSCENRNGTCQTPEKRTSTARSIKRGSEPPQIISISPKATYIPDYKTPRFRLTPPHFAYLKIAEGCNHPCSFCIIPKIRGPYRSRTVDDILKEAESLVRNGVKEINLISQDSTYYGRDFLNPVERRKLFGKSDSFLTSRIDLKVDGDSDGASGKKNIPDLSILLKELNKIKGDFWIRLLYTHPAHWTQEMIDTFATCEKVVKYVDIPLQHIHDNMLLRMRRETSRKYIEEFLTSLREKVPGVTLRTTFIVGFPGETEEYFQSLLDFVREFKFERLGVFTYSREEGTRAALMSHQIPDPVKKKRRDLIMAEQRLISRAHCETQVGKIIRVLVEGLVKTEAIKDLPEFSFEHGFNRAEQTIPEFLKNRKKIYIARSQSDAPDIDGRVYVTGSVKPGEFAEVKVIGFSDYDLSAVSVKK